MAVEGASKKSVCLHTNRYLCIDDYTHAVFVCLCALVCEGGVGWKGCLKYEVVCMACKGLVLC